MVKYLRIYVDEINRDLVDRIKFERAKQKKVRNPSQTVSPSEVNRMLALLRSILRSAADWEWIDRAPKVKLFTESQRRVRWLTRDKATEGARIVFFQSTFSSFQVIRSHGASPGEYVLTGVKGNTVSG